MNRFACVPLHKQKDLFSSKQIIHIDPCLFSVYLSVCPSAVIISYFTYYFTSNPSNIEIPSQHYRTHVEHPVKHWLAKMLVPRINQNAVLVACRIIFEYTKRCVLKTCISITQTHHWQKIAKTQRKSTSATVFWALTREADTTIDF